MNSESLTTFDLDGDTLASLVNICTKEGLTPSEVVGQIIHEAAVSAGLLVEKP